MEEAVVGATIQVLLQNLISYGVDEFKLFQDSKKDLEKLGETLITIQEFVSDAETKQVTDKPVKRWLKRLEDVAFEAYNVLDEVHYHSLRDNIHNSRSLKKQFKSIFSGSKRLKWGHKIRAINQEFQSINNDATGLGLQIRLASSQALASPETDSITSDPVFLGRDNDLCKIEEMLTNVPPEQPYSVLPIVGMGGMGKTTLAREVKKKMQTRFGTHIWVHVSPNFDATTIFKKILQKLTLENVEVNDRDFVLIKLQQALACKTYLLVLDDVWNEDRLKWEDFKNGLSGITSTKGNCIIVTTRNTQVASIVATHPVYELKGLEENICWSIIKAKAFGERDVVIPPGFEVSGRNIAERCQGLPLAANIVGGVLRGKSEDEWLSIQEKWLFNHVEGDAIRRILKLSFDNLLSPSLKLCFAYCSVFPKGAELEREELIELWMAEGFLQTDPTSDDEMEDVGDKILDLLLQRSLLQVVVDRHDNTRYRMHDLVHDVAYSVLGARYVGDASSFTPKKEAKYVRTLLFQGRFPMSMLSHLKSLHALTLKDRHVEKLPSSISQLVHLRFLNIYCRNLIELPDRIGELYHLQTLRVFSGNLINLPRTLKYLIDLRHLHVPSLTKLPGEMGSLTSLQTIPIFKVGADNGHRIVELAGLNNLRGKLKIYNLEKVEDGEEAKAACIFQKTNVVELVLKWSAWREVETNDEDVLNCLQPHPNLKRLEIYGFSGMRFPPWTLKMAVQRKGFDRLTEIKLERCCGCEELPSLGQLPHLKHLELLNLWNVKSIGTSFYGLENLCSSSRACKVFPALQRLTLHDLPKLRVWTDVELPRAAESEIFPCLEYLEICGCKELRSAPKQFPRLKEVHIERMDSGLPLADVCGIKLRSSLTKIKLVALNELESLPDGLFCNNQNLSEVEIWDCPKLRELPDGLAALNSLKSLRIWCCKSLRSVPCSSSGSLTSLRTLSLIDCEELTSFPCGMIESCAQSLEYLKLLRLGRVMNMQEMIDCLHNVPRLTELHVSGVPKFGTFSETPRLPSLRKLVIGGHLSSDVLPDGDWDSVSFKEAVDVLLAAASPSLVEVCLYGKEDWECLPTHIQHLTSLSRLQLYYFGVQELPEWLGDLSSLQSLDIRDCVKLRRLASTEAMQRLTNLTFIQVSDPLRLEDDAVPKWFKESSVQTGQYFRI